MCSNRASGLLIIRFEDSVKVLISKGVMTFWSVRGLITKLDDGAVGVQKVILFSLSHFLLALYGSGFA